MKFPNAYNGIRKIFSAEILDLIASICMVIAAVLALVAASSSNEEGALAGGLGFIAFMAAAGVLAIIGFILKLVGVKVAGRDEERFDTAFVFAIFALILTIVSSVLTSLFGSNAIWDDLVRTITTLFELFVTLYIVNGIQALAQRLDRDDMVQRGRTYFILFLILYILRLLANLIPVFFGANTATAAISLTLILVASILSLIIYIMYLALLGKAKKMLKEAKA